MFPEMQRRRGMDSIFGGNNQQQQAEFGPPDFNGGGLSAMIPQILQMLQRNKMDNRAYEEKLHTRDRNEQLNSFTSPMQQILEPQQQPVQQKILPPTYNGMSAFENEQINFKRDELRQKGKLGEGNLDVKERGQDITKELGEKRIDSTKDINQQKVDISKKRAEVYDFKARNPNWVGKAMPGGNLVFVNPQDPTQIQDTGIPSGSMDEEDRIKLLGEQKVNLQKSGQQNTLEAITARAAETRKTNAARPESSSQNTVAQNSKARELIAKYPELANHLTQDEKGNYVSKAPEGSQAADIINNALYPRAPAKDVNLPVEGKGIFERGAKTPKVEEEKAPTAPKGWKYVKKPGGGWTAIEDKGGK